MKKIVPHLRIENCHEAIEYYKEIFGGEIKNVQTGEGMEMFKGHEGKYIHAELHINEEVVIYMNDVFGEENKIGAHILLGPEMDSEEEITRVYNALSKEGTINMKLQDTFWGAKHAIVTDKYGVAWELNYQKQ